MGLFGSSKKMPTYTAPTAPTVKTYQESLNQALPFLQSEMPMAYGAREGALGDLAKGNAYYESFQPTSFEQALGNQYFQNVWPDTEAMIKHGLSLSGMEYSPILAQQLGKARGDLGYNIGSYLANQANTRATNSLQSRLDIDPYQMITSYTTPDLNQANEQSYYDWQAAVAKAEADYNNAMSAYNQKAAEISSISSLAGGGLGFLFGGPVGAAFGASLAGTASPLWGGGQTPFSLSDALAVSQAFPGRSTPTAQSVYGLSTPEYKSLSDRLAEMGMSYYG